MNQSGTSTVAERPVSTQGGSRRLSLPANILSYAILAGGATTIVLAIYVAALGHSKLPFWDEWVQIDFAANEGSGHTLDWLWRQYNQHRFVIPKLFLLADLRWFRATQTSLIVGNLTLQFLQLCLLSWSMRVLGGWRGPLWRTAVGLLAFCLFCPSQWPNLVMGITGLAFYLPPLFASLSFVGLLLYWRHTRSVDDRSPSWKYLLLSVVAGVCATYSLSNGNLVWPLLLLGAVLLRLRIAAMSALALGAAVTISAFFYNYTVYVTTSALHSRGELVGLLKYIAAYFGSSWVTNDIRRAEMLGIAGALLLVFTLWQTARYFQVSPAICIQFGLLLLFALGTGMLTAPGRFVFGIDQAFSGRYQSFALLFWCCMALLLLGRLVSLRPGGASLVMAQVAVVAVMLFAAQKTPPLLSKARWHGFNLRVASLALEADVPDRAQLAWADSRTDYARSLVPYLRSQRLSVFTEPSSHLFDQRLSSELTVENADECVGKVESTSVITTAWPRSLRVNGWAWDSRHRRAPSEIVFAADGIITGLGAVGDERAEAVKQDAHATSNYIGFAGYVRDVSRASTVGVYARVGEKSVCRIASFKPE